MAPTGASEADSECSSTEAIHQASPAEIAARTTMLPSPKPAVIRDRRPSAATVLPDTFTLGTLRDEMRSRAQAVAAEEGALAGVVAGALPPPVRGSAR